jgi:hypothetical protein
VSTDEWLLVAHLLWAFVLVGGGLGALVAYSLNRIPRPAGEMALLAQVQRFALRGLLLPGAVLALIFGMLLAGERDISFGEPWMSASFALWIALVLAAESMAGRSARVLVERASEPDASPLELADVSRGRRAAAGYALVTLIWVAMVLIMVWQPG